MINGEKKIICNMNRFLPIIFIIIFSCQDSTEKYEYIEKDDKFRAQVLKNNPGNYAELSNGFTYYQEANLNSDKGNIVLVHGFSVPSYIMETTFNSIREKGYRVLIMDLYGRGFSDNPGLPQTDELRASQVIELMDYLNIKNASMVGLSNGGRIISKIADLNPEMVTALFYIASSGFISYEEIEDKSVSDKEIEELISTYPEMAKGQVNDFFQPDQYPDWEDKYKVLQKYKGFAKALLSTNKNLISLDDVHNRIDSLRIPVYTFWGEFDDVVIYDEFQDNLEKVYPNRKEFFISNSGHLPHLENQEEFENIFFKYISIY
tara:strand:- start:3134 stop:4090 length:957 start_codon:yes stop_codon:yes gene_type:complete